MDALIETIVDKLRRLSVSQLQIILEFVNFLDWQATQKSKTQEHLDAQAEWQAVVEECAGAWPDFPTAEELRANMGQDVVREQF
ncbi:hypothetical protein [Leptothoe spongobia]|uniref:DUF2281 domain-containing protein n=1 Tax=Leptothoe spongobia TAU-MAC 1115 TaxID=1967444 RepID=A0A947GFY0_9CYAN|nr:hypothetical protein [Leptothoe spongobia]MBT9314004.1 hypothetical protein [Leptothoe spongobia TAU-MAC 1115]